MGGEQGWGGCSWYTAERFIEGIKRVFTCVPGLCLTFLPLCKGYGDITFAELILIDNIICGKVQ